VSDFHVIAAVKKDLFPMQLLGVTLIAALVVLVRYMPTASIAAWTPVFLSTALAALLLARVGSRAKEVTVRVTNDAVFLGKRRIARTAIVGAAIERSHKGFLVRLRREYLPSVDLEVATEEKARALLAAIKLDEAHAVASFDALKWGKITIGADGIMLGDRFISVGDVHVAERSGNMLFVGDGKEVFEIHMNEADAVAAHDRLQHVLALRSQGTDEAKLLERSGRNARDWLAHLRALSAPPTTRGAPFRRALDSETLLRIALDPTADGEMRAAAAVAASQTLGERARSEIAGVAGAAASPRLRVALMRVAESATDEELEDALRDLAENEPSQR